MSVCRYCREADCGEVETNVGPMAACVAARREAAISEFLTALARACVTAQLQKRDG